MQKQDREYENQPERQELGVNWWPKLRQLIIFVPIIFTGADFGFDGKRNGSVSISSVVGVTRKSLFSSL